MDSPARTAEVGRSKLSSVVNIFTSSRRRMATCLLCQDTRPWYICPTSFSYKRMVPRRWYASQRNWREVVRRLIFAVELEEKIWLVTKFLFRLTLSTFVLQHTLCLGLRSPDAVCLIERRVRQTWWFRWLFREYTKAPAAARLLQFSSS